MIVVITRVAELVVAEFMFAEFVAAIAALVGVGGTRGSRQARQRKQGRERSPYHQHTID